MLHRTRGCCPKEDDAEAGSKDEGPKEEGAHTEMPRTFLCAVKRRDGGNLMDGSLYEMPLTHAGFLCPDRFRTGLCPSTLWNDARPPAPTDPEGAGLPNRARYSPIVRTTRILLLPIFRP